MTDELSEHMARALAVIQAQGGAATPEGGGWWKGADGKRLRHAHVKLGDTYTEPVVTQTIYALTRRGLLVRSRKHRESWKDTYLVK